jgi:hypothetical protein
MIVPEWKSVLKHAWSVRLSVLAGFFSGGEVILPLFIDNCPRGIMALLAMVAAVGASVSRFILQSKMRKNDND